MTEDAVDAVAVARRLADALEAAEVPYAIGGAIAYGYFGAARGTKDVDLNLFTSPDEAGLGLEALVSAGGPDRSGRRRGPRARARRRGGLGRPHPHRRLLQLDRAA